MNLVAGLMRALCLVTAEPGTTKRLLFRQVMAVFRVSIGLLQSRSPTSKQSN